MWNIFRKKETKKSRNNKATPKTLEDILGKDAPKRKYPRRLEDFKKSPTKQPATETSKKFNETVKRVASDEPKKLRFAPKSNDSSVKKSPAKSSGIADKPGATTQKVQVNTKPLSKPESKTDPVPVKPEAEYTTTLVSTVEAKPGNTGTPATATQAGTSSKLAEKPKPSRPVKSSVFKEVMPEIHESVDSNIHLIALIGRFDGKTYFEEGDSSYDLQALTTLTSALENEMETLGLKNIRHGLIHLNDNKMMMVLFFDEHFMVFLFDENPVIPGQMLFIVRPRILELYPQALI